MEDLADLYVKEFSETKEFKEIKELKKVIDEKYKKEIIQMKNLEQQYTEAKKYADYYPQFSDLQKAFVLAKKELYEKPEVIRYFQLERQLQKELDEDMNDIKAIISNKFKQGHNWGI